MRQRKGKNMNVRVQQYYKINRHLKKAYHQRVREQAAASEIARIRELNLHLVDSFAHQGLISHEWAAALGHTCQHGR